MNIIKDIYECTVRNVDGAKRFFVSFTDINCHTQTIEVSEQIYNEFAEFKKSDQRQAKSIERHIEHISLSDEELHQKSVYENKLTDEQVLQKEYNDELYFAIERLPSTQRKRLLLNSEYDLTYKEIAVLEGCSISSVRDSIHSARKKISKTLTRLSEKK